MKNEKIYSLCEAIADISYIAAKENYRTADSREMFNQFIEWGKEFEYYISIYNGESTRH